MAKFRTSGTALAKIFERSAAIIFLIAEDWTIQYANPACADWLQTDPDALFGRKLLYISQPQSTELEDRLKAICPPPHAFHDPASATPLRYLISARVESEQSETVRYRWAWVSPVVDANHEETFLLVVSDTDDLETCPPIAAENLEANDLHAALEEIRRQSKRMNTLDSLVGSSSFAVRLRRQVEQAARSATEVQIVGPPGSGRQHLARTLHAHRPEGTSGDLILVDGSIADPTLIQTIVAELDRKQQTSSSAAKQRSGPPQRDTLLLLEADLLDGPSQAALLSAILSVKLSLTLITTSQRDLRDLAKQGEFDTELASILGTTTIELLPLWQRAEDIPLLTQALLEKSDRKHPVTGFDKAALQKLAEYRWPGNLDQLVSIVTASGEHARNRLLTVDDLPKKFHDSLRAQQLDNRVETTIELESYLMSIEKELVMRALSQSKGNKAHAARLLGLNRAKLLRRMQLLGLETDHDETEPNSSESAQAKKKSKRAYPTPLREKLKFRPGDSEMDTGDDLDDFEPLSESGEEDDPDWIGPDAFEEIE